MTLTYTYALYVGTAHYSMEGSGRLDRLNTEAMKCLFIVMSLNPALLISPAGFTCLYWILGCF